MKVLIAEDDTITLRIIRKLVEVEGHEVVATACGKRAVELFDDEQPDLVLLDLLLPGMSGYEVARRIRAICDERDDWIPIIFISVKVQDEDIVQGIDAGGDDYLTKPVRRLVLVAKIKAMQRIAQMRHRLAEANRCLRQLSETDSLTGLANRRRFSERLEEEWARARRSRQPLALLLGDVDHFKAYNDHYGHQAGDACLREVASALREGLRRPRDLLARYGGEEFVGLLPETGSEGAVHVAEAMRSAVAALLLPHARSLTARHVTISLGVAIGYPSADGAVRDDLIAAADKALYEAKRKGRNCVLCTLLATPDPG